MVNPLAKFRPAGSEVVIADLGAVQVQFVAAECCGIGRRAPDRLGDRKRMTEVRCRGQGELWFVPGPPKDSPRRDAHRAQCLCGRPRRVIKLDLIPTCHLLFEHLELLVERDDDGLAIGEL